MRQRPGISVCMIVKNEAALLPDALASIRDIADELLVGDTGSTDATVEIAKSYGATVIDVPWTDDFAAARNAVLAHATQPWILTFDADERATPSVGAWLDANLATLPTGGYRAVFHTLSTGSGYDRLCLFTNGLGIRWHRPIHEWPRWPDGRDVEGPIVPALRFIDGAGARSETGEIAKHARYAERLRQLIAANPDSHLDRLYLALSLVTCHQYDEAIHRLLELREHPVWHREWLPGTLAWQIADVYRLAGDWDQCRQWAERSIAEEPHHVLSWELIVRSIHRQSGMASCLATAEQWWAACQTDPAVNQIFLHTHPGLRANARRYVVWSRMTNGNWDMARSLAFAPDAPRDLRVHWFLVRGELPAAIAAFCAGQPDTVQRIAYWQQKLNAPMPMPSLVSAMLWASLNAPYYDELAAERFDHLVQQWPNEAEVWIRRGHNRLVRSQDVAAAIADLERAATIAPTEPLVWRLLERAYRRSGETAKAEVAADKAAQWPFPAGDP